MRGAVVRESVILTDAVIESGAIVERSIIDKHVRIGKDSQIGGISPDGPLRITTVGKNSQLASDIKVQPGAVIATDVIPSDMASDVIPGNAYIQTRRKPYEV